MKILRYLNLLSIDVMLGSVAFGVLATKVLNVKMPLAWWIILPSTVWVIYTVDHLMDAIKYKKLASSPRHLFHYQYFNWLLSICVSIATCTCISTFVFLPMKILAPGIVIGLICVVYLLYSRYLHRYSIPKEFIVAIVYTLGIWFGPMIYADNINWETSMVVFLTFLTAFNNLLLFSIFGLNDDLRSGFGSVVTSFGKLLTTYTLRILLFLTISVSFILAIVFIHQIKFFSISVIFILMNLTFGLIINYRNRFEVNDWYRIVGDGIFLLPLILILIKR